MLTLNDVCKYLGVSRFTIYRLIKSGRLYAKRVGRQWRFEMQDIDKIAVHKNTAPNTFKPLMMSLPEVCMFLGVSRSTVCRMVKSRQLTAIKSGGRWKFPSGDVRQFLTHNRDVPAYVVGINPAGGVLDMNDAAQLLGVSRKTVQRLVKEGKLPATRVGGDWRFIITEISRYMLDKKSSHGTLGIKSVFFRSNVLDKYRKDNENYYIKENAYDGLVGRRADYLALKKLQNNQYYKIIKRMHPPLFAEVHYRKIPVKGAYVLALEPRQYQYLKPEEAGHWAEHMLTDAEVGGMQL